MSSAIDSLTPMNLIDLSDRPSETSGESTPTRLSPVQSPPGEVQAPPWLLETIIKLQERCSTLENKLEVQQGDLKAVAELAAAGIASSTAGNPPAVTSMLTTPINHRLDTSAITISVERCGTDLGRMKLEGGLFASFVMCVCVCYVCVLHYLHACR